MDDDKKYGDELFIYAMALMEENEQRQREEAEKAPGEESGKVPGEETEKSAGGRD